MYIIHMCIYIATYVHLLYAFSYYCHTSSWISLVKYLDQYPIPQVGIHSYVSQVIVCKPNI